MLSALNTRYRPHPFLTSTPYHIDARMMMSILMQSRYFDVIAVD
jgi:hypothetical protein